jgi:hypothetical protein
MKASVPRNVRDIANRWRARRAFGKHFGANNTIPFTFTFTFTAATFLQDLGALLRLLQAYLKFTNMM